MIDISSVDLGVKWSSSHLQYVFSTECITPFLVYDEFQRSPWQLKKNTIPPVHMLKEESPNSEMKISENLGHFLVTLSQDTL